MAPGELHEGRAATQPASATASRNADFPTDPAALGAMLVNAQLAHFPYTRRGNALPEGWAADEQLAAAIHQQTGIGRRVGSGTIVSKTSGITASIFRNDESNEVVVAFGGTTAGKGTGDSLAKRFWRNPLTSARQVGTNLTAEVSVPRSYKEAAKILQAIRTHVGTRGNEPDVPVPSVRVVGHSKGGAEGIYAALTQKPPAHADVFSPAHLQGRLRAALPPGSVNGAADLVSVYTVRGDFLPRLRSGVKPLGTSHEIPPAMNLDAGALQVHDQFVQHIGAAYEAARST